MFRMFASLKDRPILLPPAGLYIHRTAVVVCLTPRNLNYGCICVLSDEPTLQSPAWNPPLENNATVGSLLIVISGHSHLVVHSLVSTPRALAWISETIAFLHIDSGLHINPTTLWCYQKFWSQWNRIVVWQTLYIIILLLAWYLLRFCCVRRTHVRVFRTEDGFDLFGGFSNDLPSIRKTLVERVSGKMRTWLAGTWQWPKVPRAEAATIFQRQRHHWLHVPFQICEVVAQGWHGQKSMNICAQNGWFLSWFAVIREHAGIYYFLSTPMITATGIKAIKAPQ